MLSLLPRNQHYLPARFYCAGLEPNVRKIMTTNRCFGINRTSLLLTIVALSSYAGAQAKSSNQFACKEANPQLLCVAATTCGSGSPCSVDVKRTGNGASATPSTLNAKSNALFCVKVGTTVQWKSSSRNVGFVVDMGPGAAFDPSGAILGGSDRTVSVKAKTPGCYRYSAGACVSGSIYGMCGQTNAEVVVIP
jgi:plastocyanin